MREKIWRELLLHILLCTWLLGYLEPRSIKLCSFFSNLVSVCPRVGGLQDQTVCSLSPCLLLNALKIFKLDFEFAILLDGFLVDFAHHQLVYGEFWVVYEKRLRP